MLRLFLPLLAVLLVACSQPAATPTSAPATSAPAAKPTTAPAASPGVSAAASPAAVASPSAAAGSADVTASLRPPASLPQPGNMPAGSFMRTIQDRGMLLAGVRQDVPLTGFLNPRTNQIEGFDIEFVKAITRAIFGDESKVDRRPVTAAARIPSLQDGSIDVAAAAMTITADRKNQIDFSEVYYQAGDRVLVKNDSPYNSLQDLSDKRVCTVKGSTAEQNIPGVNARAQVVQADTYNECLLSLQQGRVDAVSTDDVILSGLAQQDPSTKLVGPKF